MGRLRSAAGGENVFLLQSRPETVWAQKDADGQRPLPAARPFDHVFNLLGGKRPLGEMNIMELSPDDVRDVLKAGSTPAVWTSCISSWQT